MIRMHRTLVCALAGAVLIVSGGCTDASEAIQPPSDAPSFNGVPGSDIASLARFRAGPTRAAAPARGWIGPAGGRLEHEGFAVDVPAGAVDRATLFSIRLPADGRAGEYVVAEFGPHGATFARPVTIEFPLAGTTLETASNPGVVWWNGGWVGMGGEVSADGATLRTLTDHFSTYGTTEERGGSIAVSGG